MRFSKYRRLLITPASVLITTFCLLPLLLVGAGVDLSLPLPAQQIAPISVNAMFEQLSGAIVHSLLEWTAVCIALLTVLLATAYYRVQKDTATPIIGLAFLFSGSMDAFHTLATDRFFGQDLAVDFVSFTWALGRFFHVLVIVICIAIFFWRGNFAERRSNNLWLWYLGTALIVTSFIIIDLTATAKNLPQTQFNDSLITRPYDALNLLFYLIAGIFIVPRFYIRKPSVFTYSIGLSFIPEVAVGAYMAFGSTLLFDSYFNAAHFLKIFAYSIPLVGLILNYTRTQQVNVNSRRRLEATVAAMPDMFIEIDQEGTFLDFKPARDFAPSVPPAAFLGKNISEIFPALAGPAMDQVKRAIANDVNTAFEYQLPAPDEEVFVDYEARVTPIDDNRALIIVRDISRMKQIEINIRRTNRELSEANLMKSQFLANMSHELRTPLNSIIGFSSGLKDNKELNEVNRDRISRIHRNGNRLLLIINQILDLSKIDSGQAKVSPQAFFIHQMVADIIAGVEPHSKLQNITIDFEPNQVEVESDITKVRQIIGHLLDNALKFAGEGGQVRIRICNGDPTGQHVGVEVFDNGIGIAAEDHSKIFEPFRQVDGTTTREYEGTGLGLTIAGRLASMLSGEIEVESTLGKGAMFRLKLPKKWQI